MLIVFSLGLYVLQIIGNGKLDVVEERGFLVVEGVVVERMGWSLLFNGDEVGFIGFL